jgi:hypothetical protein
MTLGRRGYSHLKEEALYRIKWRSRFGRGCGPVVWQITDEWMNIYSHGFANELHKFAHDKRLLRARDISAFRGDVFTTVYRRHNMSSRQHISSPRSRYIFIVSPSMCEVPYETKGRVVS